MTNDEQLLNRTDRGTLIAWRAANLVAWGLVSLAASLMVGLVIVDLQYLAERHADFRHAFAALYALGSAAVIGWIVGRRAYRSAELVAFIVALVQIWAGRFFVTGFRGIGAESLLYALTHLAGAAVVARIAWGRRPAAFRGGRRERPV